MRKTIVTLPVLLVMVHAACGNDSSDSGSESTGGNGSSEGGDAGAPSSPGGKGGSEPGMGGKGGAPPSSGGQGGIQATTGGAGGADTGAGGAGGADTSSGGVGGVDTGAGGAGGAGGAEAGGADGEAGSAGSATTPCTLTGSWELIDDFQLSPGEHSFPAAIATAPPNRLYAVGGARMGTFQWYVRRSIDGGDNWENLDVAAGAAADVAVDSNGVVYVTGSRGTERILRRSTNGGDDWTTVDTIPVSETDPCSAGSLVVTSDDSVYIGDGCDLVGTTVRRSPSGGDSFSEVEAFQYMTDTTTRMGTLGVDADDQIYLGGVGIGEGAAHWLVRRGTGMGTWNGVDDYQLAAGYEASLSGFGGRDAIYAVGYALDAEGITHSIVRRAELDDPANFTTVDDVSSDDPLDTHRAQSLYQSPTGIVIVAGQSTVGTSPGRVVYRRSDDGSTWDDAGEFAYLADTESGPSGRLAADAAGNVYGMVRGVDEDGFSHWVVTRLACNE